MATYTPYELSWTTSEADERGFQKLVAAFLVLFLIASVSVSYIPIPKQERSQIEKLPPRLAKMILERKKVIPPPTPEIKIEKPPKLKKEEPKKIEKKKEPEKKKEKKIEKKEPPKPKPIKQKTPEQRVDAARQKAASSGILAFSDDLADLRDAPILQNNAPLTTGQPQSSNVEHSMITAMSGKSSGGINTNQLSRSTGGVQLSDRSTTVIESPLEQAAHNATAFQKPKKQLTIRERSKEAVILKIKQNEGAINSIHKRALRVDPTLQGMVTVEIIIAQSGKVTNCKFPPNEYQSKEVLKKVCSRIKFINFGAESVSEFTIKYNFDFLPT